MTQKTKFENELDRAMTDAELNEFMREEYTARKNRLLRELVEINDQLRKL